MKNFFESPQQQKSPKREFPKKQNHYVPPLPLSPPPELTPPSSPKKFELTPLESSPFKPPIKTTENLVTQILNDSTTPPKQRLMSNTSSCTNYTLKSDFRILNPERSVTPSSKSLNSLNNLNNQSKLMIKHIPDAVDEVKLEYEGQRHVVIPGYMTSADILRNILLNNPQTTEIKNAAPLSVKQNESLSLKEKLLLQQSEEDDLLEKKFNSQRNRTRSMSGIIALDMANAQTTQIIDINLDDYETEITAPQKPPRTFHADALTPFVEQVKLDSTRTTSSSVNNGSRRIQKLTVTGSFDPNDFDSFDEEDYKLENDDLKQQEMNLVQFDPEDFDSFDEEEVVEEVKEVSKPLPVIKLEQDTSLKDFRSNRSKLEAAFNNKNTKEESEIVVKEEGQSFFRSALDRISTRSSKIKSRSSSVPSEESRPVHNVKTLNLMNKMQSEYEEKQKRKKQRQDQKLEEEKRRLEISKSPKGERKFLSSIINTLFSSGQKENLNENGLGGGSGVGNQMVKNESKRLSLRRLKAKDKARKEKNDDDLDNSCDFDTKSEINYQSDGEYGTMNKKGIKNSKSNPVLNLEQGLFILLSKNFVKF